MVERIIEFGLRQRLLITALVIGLVLFGVYAFRELPVDAFPDVTNVQVQIITEAPGMSPEEVEKYVSHPVEVQMTGLPRVQDTRSLSKYGISMITVVFKDDVDIYFARQLVLERLIEAKEKLPPGIEPVMGPISTGLGEVYQYTLEKPGSGALTEQELTELRTLQDWVVKPILKNVPGVTDVNAFGGMVKQYQVVVDPDRLKKYDVSLREAFSAVANNNANAGGSIIEHSAEQIIVRGIGLIKTLDDVGSIVIKSDHGTPVFVRDIAEVRFGPEARFGAVVKDGTSEAVAGIVMMIRGGSGREIVAGVKKKVDEINSSTILPDGIKIKPFYDRSDLVNSSINTVSKALVEGAILVVVVLYLFLRNLRGALVVALTLPLAVLATFIIMWKTGLSANLMSLGGLAISLGMIVDAAIIQVENVQRHLSEKGAGEHNLNVILGAVLEVRKPSLFGELIIAITFVPIMTLQGMEGKMFTPLAFTVVIALCASLLLSIFVVPVMCSFFMKPGEEKESFIVAWANKRYRPALAWSLVNGRKILTYAGASLAFAVILFFFLGTEFVPTLNEGTILPQVIRLPSISLTESVKVEKKAQQALMKIQEVKTIVSRIGTPEIATDLMGPNLSDMFVILKPKDEWKDAKTMDDVKDRIRAELEKISGIGLNITQPIAMRVDELISGVKSQIAVKLFGDDMAVLEDKAAAIAKAVSKVEGAADLRVEQTTGQPYLTVDIDRKAIARYGINVADVQEIIETAVGGKTATEVLEGDRRFSVFLRFPEERRSSAETIGNILVRSSNGANIPLAQLAKISLSEGPVQISRENGKRRIVIECNVEGRDIGGFVAEAKGRIEKAVKLPAGYYLSWGGAFENQQRAMNRLLLIVPATVVIIFFLLFTTFKSVRHASLILMALPFGLIGGVLALFLSGQYLSVPASVGFISLFGVAVLNGMVLITAINELRAGGTELHEAITAGCERRLRPVLMTALVAILGLTPLMFATGPGSEIQKPLAAVMIGGLITSTFMTLLVLPVLYQNFEENRP